ncbi:MAG: hypothetical protein M3P98_00935 [bacterium]|nr:hypothetical protein [bacterium]
MDKIKKVNTTKLIILLLVSLAYSWIFLIELFQISQNSSVGYLTMVISFAVNVGITSFILLKAIDYLKKQKDQNNTFFLFKVFVVWAAAEWLTSLLATLIWIGVDGSIDSVAPFASLTPTLSYTPISFLARIFGFHGLSAIFVTLLVALWTKKYRKQGYALLGLIVILWLFSFMFWRSPNGGEVNVTIVAEKLTGNKTIQTDSDVVILPEYGLDRYEDEGSRIVSDHDVFFVGSRQGYVGNSINNQFIFGSNEKGIISTTDKSRLIPGGEYLPYLVDIPLKIFNQKQTLLDFDFARAVTKGESTQDVTVVNDDLTLGSAVCSSIVNQEDYRRMTNRGANLLTNSASLGIFGGSHVYEFQHVGMAHFHAVANARPFLQSTLDFPAFALDQNGRQIAMINPINSSDLSVRTNNKKTLYTLVGDWAVWIGIFYLVWAIAKWFRFERN